ncbi:MAG: maleate cis-trans isomerase, partial [Sciscionella sp.]
MTTLGFLYPGHAAEDDYPRMQAMLGDRAELIVAHTYGQDLHAVRELLDLGSPHRLAQGAAQLRVHRPDAVLWACTSGSFVYGPEGAQRQLDALAEAAGVPASSTSFAFLHAIKALGLHRVAIAASYPAEVAALFADFLAAGGIEVLGLSSAGITTAAAVGALNEDEVISFPLEHD